MYLDPFVLFEIRFVEVNMILRMWQLIFLSIIMGILGADEIKKEYYLSELEYQLLTLDDY